MVTIKKMGDRISHAATNKKKADRRQNRLGDKSMTRNEEAVAS